MITLAPGNTIQGMAATASAVTMSAFGLEISSIGLESYKPLYQGQLPNSVTILYTVPALNSALVKTINLANTTGSSVLVTLFVNGSTAGFQQASIPIPANGEAIWSSDGWKVIDGSGNTLFSTANAVITTRNLIAGSGMTGGGDLTLDRTFNVVANVDGSIVVNADDVQVGILATDAQHGNRGGGALHANAVAAGAAGFMTGADKTKLNTLDTTSPPGSRSVIAGSGLTGGGDLSADRTMNVIAGDSTIVVNADEIHANVGVGAGSVAAGNDSRILAAVPNSRSVVAGAGLTGGGDLSADRTFNVVANVDGSIVVAADDVKVGVLATDAQHGVRGGGTQHAVATSAAAGFMGTAAVVKIAGQYDAQADFGFVGDLKTPFIAGVGGDGSITATQTLMTCSTGPFVLADVGKRITVPGAGAASAQLTTTIASFVSATQVNLTLAASTTVSGKSVTFGTDNTAAITAMMTAVNSAAYPGASIRFGQSVTNSYGFPIPVTFSQNVQIEGIGGGHTADTGDYQRLGGTRLAWWGTSSDGGVPFGGFITVNPTGVMSLKHVSFRSCWLDCRNCDQNQALYGLKLQSCHGWQLDDFFVMDALAIAIWFDIGTTPTEAKDTTRGMASNYCIRALDNTSAPVAPTLTPTTTISAVSLVAATSLTLAAANGLTTSGYAWVQTSTGKPCLVRYTGGGGTQTLTGVICSTEDAANVPTTVSGSNVVQCTPGNSCGIYLNGGTGANTSCNVFLMGQISHGSTWGPAAVEFGNSDSNDFNSLYINGGNRTSLGAINRMQKPGVRFNGSNQSVALASRNNTFRGGDPGSLPTTNGGVENMGLLNTGAAMAFPAGPNYWDLMQMGNGAPVPKVEPFSSFQWFPNGGLLDGSRGDPITADQAIPAAALTQLGGSIICLPPQAIQIGTTFRWKFDLSKTALGTLGSLFQIRLGPAGGNADPVIQAATSPVGTAAIDIASFEVEYTISAIGAAANGRGRFRMVAKSAAAGAGWSATNSMNITGTPTAFNSVTSAFLFIGLYITSGSTVVPTLVSMTAEVVDPGSP